jgi:hypothetical protein
VRSTRSPRGLGVAAGLVEQDDVQTMDSVLAVLGVDMKLVILSATTALSYFGLSPPWQQPRARRTDDQVEGSATGRHRVDCTTTSRTPRTPTCVGGMPHPRPGRPDHPVDRHRPAESELLGLLWSDFNADAGTLSVMRKPASLLAVS